jgi:hypothetical protein
MLTLPDTMELDIFVPPYSLAFEYQGQQHYKPNYVLGTPEKVQKRDQEKLATCQQNGITLIQVPHWYKMDKQVIQELIRKYRPDVVNILP